jgi:hypothetical protein
VPYGFERHGSGIRPHASETHAISVALTMRAHGATYATIGEYFVASGIRLRRGKRWHPEVIRRILITREAQGLKRAPLDNLAKRFLDLPMDPNAV